MWRDLEEEAIFIGLDISYFWTLTPKLYQKHQKVFMKKEKERIREKDNFNYMLGKYIAYAFNDPKKYPKVPFLEEQERKSVSHTSESLEEIAMRNTILLGGVIKK